MRKAPKREAVLEFIRSKGNDGATFGEIQRFIVEMNGLNYDEMQPAFRWDPTTLTSSRTGVVRRWRGYWCTNLCGAYNWSTSPRLGILQMYCDRKVNGHYVLKSN